MTGESVDDILGQLKEQPDNAELYQRLGNLYFKLREIENAWEAYMQAFRLNPDDPFTCLYFANMLTTFEDKRFAAALYAQAVKVAPQLAVVHWCKAEFHKSQGEFELAGQEFEKAVEVEPRDPQAQAKLAQWREFIDDVRRS